jgi:hypothetical protein
VSRVPATSGTGTSTVRRYVEEDEAGVLRLLQKGFGQWPIVEGAGELDPVMFFRWKHVAVPGGPSRMVVAEDSGRMVGFRAFMPWGLEGAGRVVRALRGADAVTLPELQGSGVFGKVRRAAEDLYPDPVELYFGTPNEGSRRASAKLGGRSTVGTINASVRVRPLRAAAALVRGHGGVEQVEVDAEHASTALASEPEVEGLLAAARCGERRLATIKDARWLRWRYGESPLRYRGLRLERSGRLVGLAIFRLRRRRAMLEAVVEELFVQPGDRRSAGRLLRDVRRSAPVALVSSGFPPGTTAATAAALQGFVPWRGGIQLMVKPMDRGIAPPPSELGSWALSLGDLEVL